MPVGVVVRLLCLATLLSVLVMVLPASSLDEYLQTFPGIVVLRPLQ